MKTDFKKHIVQFGSAASIIRLAETGFAQTSAGESSEPDENSMRAVLHGLCDDGCIDAPRIVHSLPGQTPAIQVHRVLTELGILEARDGELVIVELAPGVSAREMQRFCEPTLKISPDVKEMLLVDDD